MRLHRDVRSPGGVVDLLDHGVGLPKPGLDVAVSQPEEVADVRPLLRSNAEVRGVVPRDVCRLVDQYRPLRGGLHLIEDGGKLLVVDVYEPHRLLGLVGGLGGDARDYVPGVANSLLRKDLLILYLRPVAAKIPDFLRRGAIVASGAPGASNP